MTHILSLPTSRIAKERPAGRSQLVFKQRDTCTSKMSVTNGESEVKPEILKTLLVEETVYLVPEHFDDLAASILARKAVVKPLTPPL